MRKPNAEPCNECPMRRNSLPGWTGEATPEELIDAMGGHGLFNPCHAMPCHKTVDYSDPNWQKQLGGQRVRQCAGQAIYLGNICKVPKPNETAIAGRQDHKLVFSNRIEFLAHHKQYDKP